MTHAIIAVAMAVSVQQTDTTLAVRPNGRIEIDNHAGRIAVRTWDREEVRIRATHGRNIYIDIERTGSTVQVDAEPRRGGPGNVEFDITVPRSFNIEIDAINSSIDVADLNGDVHAETVNGTIVLAGIAGRIDVSSVQGRVTVRDSRGSLEASTVNEAVNITNFTGNVEAETVNGNIVLNGIRADVVSAETVNGSVEYQGEIRSGGRYSLSTHNGNISVLVPEGTNATVSVETFQGEIESDFPIQMRGGTGRQRMNFTIGNGGARLHLASFGGSIRLRRPAGNR